MEHMRDLLAGSPAGLPMRLRPPDSSLSSGRTVCDASSDFARLHPCVRAVETARLGICLCPSGGEPRGLANSSPDHRRPATWVRRSAHVAPSSANRIGPAALKRHRPGSLQTISAPSASARTRPGVNCIRKLIHFLRSHAVLVPGHPPGRRDHVPHQDHCPEWRGAPSEEHGGRRPECS